MKERFTARRNYVLLVMAAGFAVGCALAPFLSEGLWLMGVFALGIALAILLRKDGRMALIGILLCVMALGVLRTWVALSPVQPAAGKYEVSGYVYGAPTVRSDDRLAFTLGEITLDGERVQGFAYGSLYVYGDEPLPELFDGAKVSFSGRVYLPDGKDGEPRFDFRAWLYRKGMSFGITASNGVTIENTLMDAPVKDLFSRLRATFTDALTSVMGENGSWAAAMLLSDTGGLEDTDYQAFQALGIAHVLCVSGLHVGLLCALLYALLRRLHAPWVARFYVITCFLVFYCALTGFAASTLRASVTTLLSLLARRFRRRGDSLIRWSAAMLVVLLIQPLHLFSSGFIQSFGVVAGILLLVPSLWRLFPERRVRMRRTSLRYRVYRLRRKLGIASLRETLLFCVAAQLSALLPTAYFYHQLPLWGLPMNVLLTPYFGFLLPMYAVTLLLSPIPLIGDALGFVASLMTDGLLGAVRAMNTLPLATLRVAQPGFGMILLCVVAMVLCSLRVMNKAKPKLIILALATVFAVGHALYAQPPALRYYQLAVGQADAALVMDGDTTLAIDVGDDGRATSAYLMAEGRDIDALFLTHLHLDHAGGVARLLEDGIRIKQVYVPANAERQRIDPECAELMALLRTENIPITELAAGDELRYNEVSLSVQWPTADAHVGQDANDMPLVLLLRFGDYRLLSASDLGGTYEAYAATPADVLKVAHHGSNSSTSDAFLSYVSPRAAIVTCSSSSRWLPGAETVERIASHGIPLLRTDETGDLLITIDQAGQLCLTPYKVRQQQ